MTLSKSEVNPKPQEKSNTDSMKDQHTTFNDLTSNFKSGPKPKFQTKICDHWRRSGSCSYGDACWYAHGEDDLRKVNLNRNHRLFDEKMNAESERGTSFNLRNSDLTKEDGTKLTKPADEMKMSPSKRVSTNVKGLTVSIPASIAFKEQPPADSMPLSPAQERWVSMSAANLGFADRSESPENSTSSTLTMKNGSDGEQEKKITMENVFERRPPSGNSLRDEDIDDYGFFSPNPYSYPQATAYPNALPPQTATGPAYNRPLSRGPHQRTFAQQNFGGMSSQHSSVSTAFEQSRVSRFPNSSYFDQFPVQKSNSFDRSSRENLQVPTNTGPAPPIQQAIWNVAGEIYQRQKNIEACGMRNPTDQHNMLPREHEMSRLLEKLKMKDLSCLRFLIERGLLRERDVPRQTWNELINNGLNQTHSQQSNHFHSDITGLTSNDQNGSDCSCKHTRPKLSHDSSVFSPHFAHPHNQHQSHNFSQNQHQYYSQSQQHPMYRQPNNTPLGAMSSGPELLAPPKIFESLLPSDEAFSIWLDTKPKKESGGFIRPTQGIEHSNSNASLLAKMDVLRTEKFPISEEEIQESSGSAKAIPSGKRSNSESSSPPVLSLMELLSSENLLEETKEHSKTTMFDFDTLKITETLRNMPQQSDQSMKTTSENSSRLFFVDEKTPNPEDYYSKQPSTLFTPLTGQTPSFLEQCDFFAAGGSCPFGDGCQLSHSSPTDQQQQQQLEAI